MPFSRSQSILSAAQPDERACPPDRPNGVKSESTNKFGEIPDPPSGCILDRRRRSRRRPAANVSVLPGYRTRPASASKRHKTSCRQPGQAVTFECLSPKRWSSEGAAPHGHRLNRSTGTAICPRSEGVRSRRTTGFRGALVRTDDGGEAPAGSGRSLGHARASPIAGHQLIRRK